MIMKIIYIQPQTKALFVCPYLMKITDGGSDMPSQVGGAPKHPDTKAS